MLRVLRCLCAVLVSGLALSVDVSLALLDSGSNEYARVRALPLAVAAEASRTDAARRLAWEDLAPPFDDSKNPFKALNEEQQDALHQLLWLRTAERDGSAAEALTARALAVRESLEESGADPDSLLAQIDEFDRHIAVWNESLVDELNGREVQIAGYALPLEFSQTAITEFLLVPYVGACIHVPPPPTNQIVHVQVASGFESKGLFTPVWVTGRISTRPQSLSLFLVDGSSDISVGYGLEATEIAPYSN